CQGRAEYGYASHCAVRRDVDSEGVERSFDEDGEPTAVEDVAVLGKPVEVLSLDVQGGLSGVDVLRIEVAARDVDLPVLIEEWVAATDEPNHLRIAIDCGGSDRKHESVAEPVYEPAGFGADREPGVQEFNVAEFEVTQMLG